jgi:hypothetical protein
MDQVGHPSNPGSLNTTRIRIYQVLEFKQQHLPLVVLPHLLQMQQKNMMVQVGLQ